MKDYGIVKLFKVVIFCHFGGWHFEIIRKLTNIGLDYRLEMLNIAGNNQSNLLTI